MNQLKECRVWQTEFQSARQFHTEGNLYYPLLYTLGMKNTDDDLLFFNEKVNYGSVSMRSMVYGKL